MQNSVSYLADISYASKPIMVLRGVFCWQCTHRSDEQSLCSMIHELIVYQLIVYRLMDYRLIVSTFHSFMESDRGAFVLINSH